MRFLGFQVWEGLFHLAPMASQFSIPGSQQTKIPYISCNVLVCTHHVVGRIVRDYLLQFGSD